MGVKRAFIILLVILSLLVIYGCGGSESTVSSSGTTTTTTSTTTTSTTTTTTTTSTTTTSTTTTSTTITTVLFRIDGSVLKNESTFDAFAVNLETDDPSAPAASSGELSFTVSGGVFMITTTREGTFGVLAFAPAAGTPAYLGSPGWTGSGSVVQYQVTLEAVDLTSHIQTLESFSLYASPSGRLNGNH